jgi:hypothetical protein
VLLLDEELLGDGLLEPLLELLPELVPELEDVLGVGEVDGAGDVGLGELCGA